MTGREWEVVRLVLHGDKLRDNHRHLVNAVKSKSRRFAHAKKRVR
jgi:hypothetical protein